MSTTATVNTNPSGSEQDEKVVEEVHCAECGVPMTAIPNWYATVRVKFTCDTCRQKSPRMNAVAANEAEPARDSAVDTDLEEGLDDEDTEAEEDVEIELEEDAGDVEE